MGFHFSPGKLSLNAEKKKYHQFPSKLWKIVKNVQIIKRIFIHSSLFVLNFMLSACRPNSEVGASTS